MLRLSPAILISSLVAFLAGSASGQNLIVNGGFETPPAAGSGNNTGSPAYYSNNTGLTQVTPPGTGWTFGLDTTSATDTARIEWFKSGASETWDRLPSATGGTYALELNSDSNTEHLYAQQAVSLTAGKSYTLKLDIAPEIGTYNNTTPSVVVTLRNGTALGSTAVQTFTFTATAGQWTTVTTTFQAMAGETEIRFEDLAPNGTPQSNITLDNISLIPVTPEPGALWSASVLALSIVGLERKRLFKVFSKA